MVLGRKCKFLLFLFILCLSPRLFADNIPVINITEKTDPKIAELYQQLQNTQEKIDNLESERRDKLSENYTAMREKENSKENRLLTGLSTAATGLGGMQLAQGLAEQSANKEAESDMAAYIKTMRCSYGSGNFVTAGPEPVELPGGNDATLMSLRSEYIALAKSLKERKESLGLKPGIESEEILDKANMGLYDDENVGITGGNYASLYRATALNSEDDQAQINAEKEKSANRVKYGGIAAGAGVVGGIVGNVIINKDAPKEQSSEINSEYNAQVREAKAEQQTLSAQLNAAIAENKKKFEEYNKKLQEHKDNLSQIQSASPQCQEQLAGYVSVIESLEPIENETDEVPDITFPEYNSDLLQKCTDCETKGGVFNPNTLECPCPTDKPVERDGVCSEEIVEPTPPENPISTPEEPPVENPEDPDVCGVGKRHTAGFGITEGVTRIGDPCSSALVLEGVVFKRRNGTCGCSAVLCDSRNGRAPMAQGGRCVCDASRGYKDDQGRCVCDTENGWQNVDGACVRAAPQSQPEAPTPTSRELKYYNCGNVNPGRDNATQEMLTNGTCKYVQDFNRRKVTPMQADGLMREWALEKYNDVIECDADSHRTQAEKNSYGDKWRNCVSTGPNEQYYEFVFKSLSGGDGGFYDALCSIWGLKSGVHSCKDATEEQCNKISAAVGRSFFHGGSASLTNNGVYIGSRAISQSIECNIVEHQRAQSGPVALFNTTITQEDMHRFGNINPLRFYDKIFQVNANSGVIYDVLNHYLFDELHLPVKPFSCGSSFVDNTNYFDGPRSQYTELNNQYSRCVEDSQRFSGGGEHAAQAMGGAITGCRRQYPIETKTGDLLTCTYDGHQIDFLFQKLDVIWDRKSTAGYQALRCYTEGGDFTGKSCVLADKAACDRFNAAFAREFPNTRGMEWDPEMNTCVLKDVSQVRNVQRVAETVGFVAVTLVSAIGGGPVVWVLSAVEATALVTEAVTEESLNNWAERFLTDAGRCNGSGASSACADTVLRNHIARIIGGIRYFSETQATAIKNKIEQLTAMLSTEIISAIVDKGVASGYISEDHEPDMEKSIQAYYGTTLTGGERTLLAANRVATVLTFATLIGGGVMAGLRQSFKRGWINISKAKQAKWIDLRILKQADVAEDVFAMSKMGQRAVRTAGNVSDATRTVTQTDEVADATQVATRTDDVSGVVRGAPREMTYAEANNLRQWNARIEELEAKTTRTQREAAELKQLHQKRNTLLNKIGTKDADELAQLSEAAFHNQAVADAQSDYDKLIRKRNEYAEYMNAHNGNPPQGIGQAQLNQLNDEIAAAERQLKELGQDVTPLEPLRISNSRARPTPTQAEPTPTRTETTPSTSRGGGNGARPGVTTTTTPNQPGKRGWDLGESLHNAGMTPYRFEPNGFFGVKYRTGEQCATGLKFHVSVNPDDLERASFIIDDLVKNSDAVDTWKVYLNGMDGSQLGKDFTIYVSPNGYNAQRIQNFVNDLETALKRGNIRSNGFGSNILSGDKRVLGSDFINYRYDLIDGAGHIHPEDPEFYNDVYHFVAPDAKYGGDIMDGVGIGRSRPQPRAKATTNAAPRPTATPKASPRTTPSASTSAGNVRNSQSGANAVQTPSPVSASANNVSDAANRAVNRTDDIAALRRSASQNFDTYLAEAKTSANGKSVHMVPKERLNDAEWRALNESLANENIQLVEVVQDGGSYMQFVRTDHIDEVEIIGVEVVDAGKAMNISASGTNATNIATLRRSASQNFDVYLAEAKTSANGKSVHMIPKSRLNDSEWRVLNESLANENIQLVEVVQDGNSYMQFVRADHVDDVADVARRANYVDDVVHTTPHANIPSNFSSEAKRYINEINEIGETRDYVVIKGVGNKGKNSPLTTVENNYVNQLLQDRNDLVVQYFVQPNGAGGDIGGCKVIFKKTSDMFPVETSEGIEWHRRIATKPVPNLRGKAITTINGKPVFLEPLDNGGLIGNVSGRPVVVVNYNGHRIPFYASSGSAGKLDVPTGKWEVFFGFGRGGSNPGWFNKADINAIVNHYDSPELKKIAEALDSAIGDQRNIEDVVSTISRRAYNGKGIVASYEGPAASKSFINSLLDFTPIDYGGSTNQLLRNIEHVKGYFKF